MRRKARPDAAPRSRWTRASSRGAYATVCKVNEYSQESRQRQGTLLCISSHGGARRDATRVLPRRDVSHGRRERLLVLEAGEDLLKPREVGGAVLDQIGI